MAVSIASTLCADVADIRAKLCNGDRRTSAMLAAALFCAVTPMDIPQLLLVLLGAIACALLQPVQVPSPRRAAKALVESPRRADEHSLPWRATAGWSQGPVGPTGGHAAASALGRPRAAPAAVASRPERAVRQCPGAPIASPSVMPVAAPKFTVAGWDAQVEELVGSLVPTPASFRATERLSARLQRTLDKFVQGAEVVAYASSALSRGGAYGVAVPDVDVVVSCSPEALTAKVCGGCRKQVQHRCMDARHLQKAVLRALADRLAAASDFKFRRSAFSAEEPKVTMLATDSAGSVAFDLAVNCASPLHNAALIAECGRLDARARALVLLVRRWARDRAICHAAKGHLSPYCWTLMAIYFLQVEGLLPPLRGFAAA
eukprot:CAMPEP_0176210752 /NCGR_PEP_ID=MMETSP0121_2-20121125/14303_1 /TAXON_ID=160619 /ORGANISM="Kryptoperidinium foliaceum, Strain CCMP 1326" /LENGTH=374 /DNA_ID=CAMNT_0017549789 /DNA_START=86 /DNA_END=1206 /DNA_ORIENTATION=+